MWFRHEFGGVDFKLIWANPHWPMWYLSALFFWRLATPVFKRMPAKVVVAVAISLGAGLYATNLFDNARILGLLPFFVLGLKMHEGHWNLLRTRRARWYGAAVLLVLFVVAYFADSMLETEWFYWRTRYDVVEPDNLRAFTIRMCLLLVGLIGAFAFFAVVPRTKTWFSALGGATVVVYLFHGFVVLGAEFLGAKEWSADHWPLSLLRDHRARRAAGAGARAETGREPVERAGRPDRCVHPKASRSGPQLGLTALNGTTSLAQRALPGQGVPAEVGGVPRRDLARTRPVVRQLLHALEQLGHRVPETVRGRRPRPPCAATYIGAPKARSTRRPRVQSIGGSGSPTEKIRCVPQIPTGTTGTPVSRARCISPAISGRTVKE